MYVQVGEEDEKALVGRCLAGETAAFQPLVERYHGPLFRVAVRMLGNRDEAQDATQNAFLRAYQSLRGYDPQRRFFSWIYRILVNECLNVVRARRPTEALDETLVEPGSTPVDAAEASETTRRVRQALTRIPAEQRDVIVLRHFAGMTYEEVGQTLGIPEKMVKSRLFIARQRLVELLQTV